MVDILIKNASVTDGRGGKSYIADIAVKDGIITQISKNITDSAKKTINADGLTATPGFIDSHSHADGEVLDHRHMKNILLQGITTSMTGQCAGSDAPCFNSSAQNYEQRKTVKDWFNALEKNGIGSNVSLFAGHQVLRDKAMGIPSDRKASPTEMQEMKDILLRCMDEGARGFCSGTYYEPCMFADTDELVELCKTATAKGGMFACHIRSESIRLIESVEEMIEIARRSGAKTIISHHKAAGGPNYWGLSKQTLALIEQARAEGVRIWADVYPYSACSTSLWATFIPPEYQVYGKEKVAALMAQQTFRDKCRDWITERFITYSWKEKGLSWCMLVGLEKAYTQYNGLRINEAAKIHGKDEFETLFDVLAANGMSGRGVLFTMNEEDVERIISAPYVMIGTDGSITDTPVHPRSYSTFPRAIAHYCRARSLMPFEEMIRKMTSLPAQVYELRGKGILDVGMDADICIFDPEKLTDTATFAQPWLPNRGFEYILVNGAVAVEKDSVTGVLAGKALRK